MLTQKIVLKGFYFKKRVFILKRRYPDSNWGSRICNPLPYRLAISPIKDIKLIAIL